VTGVLLRGSLQGLPRAGLFHGEKIAPGVEIQARNRPLHALPKVFVISAFKPYLNYGRSYQNLHFLLEHGLPSFALFAYNTLSTTAQYWR
jgi:hypothetical protein